MLIPKQARARLTRQRILCAAAESLTEFGYAGASTNTIAKRAGVSQGALFRHFPSKTTLLCEATRATFSDLRAEFVQTVLARHEPTADLVELSLDTLWGIFIDPRLLAVFELYLAARTDESLGDELQPILIEHMQAIVGLAARLFPNAESREDFDGLVGAMMSTLQGAALAAAVMPTDQVVGLELVFIKRMVREELGEMTLSNLEMLK